jgi:hypothetical protein
MDGVSLKILKDFALMTVMRRWQWVKVSSVALCAKKIYCYFGATPNGLIVIS